MIKRRTYLLTIESFPLHIMPLGIVMFANAPTLLFVVLCASQQKLN